MRRFADQRVTPGGVLSSLFMFFLIIIFSIKTTLFPPAPDSTNLNQTYAVEEETHTEGKTGTEVEIDVEDEFGGYLYPEATVAQDFDNEDDNEDIDSQIGGFWTY